MIPQSRLIAALALALALGVHAAAALLQAGPDNRVELAGDTTELAALGSAFADMTAGLQETVQAEETAETPDQPVRPETVEPTPGEAQASVPLVPDQGVAERPEKMAAMDPLAAKLAPRGEVQVPPTPADQSLSQLVERTVSQAETVVEPAQIPATVQPADAPQRVEPRQPDIQKVRPELVQVAQQPIEQPDPPAPQPQKSRPKPRGNSDVDASRGGAEGRSTAPQGESRKANGTATVQGNAAASTYAGLVMRQIERRKRSTNIRGIVRVSFKIGPDGSLSGLRVAQSSGSGKLDSLALAQVQQAAPFPPPPPGARTSFAIHIKGE